MTQLTRGLWANGDEHRGKRKATSTVRHTLLRWPAVLVLAAASSGVGECQGGVNGVETMMVASFG